MNKEVKLDCSDGRVSILAKKRKQKNELLVQSLSESEQLAPTYAPGPLPFWLKWAIISFGHQFSLGAICKSVAAPATPKQAVD